MLSGNFTGNYSRAPHGVSRETVARDRPGDVASHSFAYEFIAQLELISAATPVPDGDCVGVLDVGTGTAQIPIEICSRRGEIRCTAVDRAARALQTARRNVEQAGLSRVIGIAQAEADSLPFADASFDAVISSGLLHHVSNQPAVLSEMARVLRPGGLLLIRDTLKGSDAGQIARILSRNSGGTCCTQRAVQNDFHAMLNIDEVREMALAAGLPSASVRQAGRRHWTLAFRRQQISELGPVQVDAGISDLPNH
jgi:SAM-dependent methyltransferase